MTVKRSKRPAPGFLTLDDEVAYWGRHGSDRDVAEDRRAAFEVAPAARSRMISIRLPGDLLDGIRAVARVRKDRSRMRSWSCRLRMIPGYAMATDGVPRLRPRFEASPATWPRPMELPRPPSGDEGRSTTLD